MDLGSWVLTVALAFLVGLIVKRLISRPSNLPPGPSGLPFLGVLLKIYKGRSDPIGLFSSWAKEYGEIASFYVGTKPFILLSSHSIAAEAFRNPDLQDRPQVRILQEISGLKNSGVGLSSGEVWKDQRKFVHGVFRNLGVGKKSYEDTVAAEMDQLADAIREKKGSAFDPHEPLTLAVANVICSIIFGTQYKYSDPDFRTVIRRINTTVHLAGGAGVYLFFPLPGISKIPFGYFKKFSDNIRKFHAFMLSAIDSHEKHLDPDNPKDFIDQYLNKLVEVNGTKTNFTKMNLKGCINDLFLAGADTTSTTLKWCLLYIIAYPDVQSRVQEELDRVLGPGRLARLDDGKNLPYTNAVLMESQRMAAIAPLGVPHVAAAETTVKGYTIPKGATILTNIWYILNNDEKWDDSETFKPERFLDNDGKLIKRDDLIFFGTGRRTCIGEQLARMETFLGFTSLVQRFTFKKPANSPPLSFEGVLGVSRNPVPFQICAVPRG